ncbi:MAG: 30S ribosomal protein THX [Saprospiraceae bacterium]|nr:30S ribosomal protein THX [Saprospiraceae bacterium]
MGKGDKKTKRGKIIMGSYGKTRVHKTPKPAADTTTAKKAAAKKRPAKAKK